MRLPGTESALVSDNYEACCVTIGAVGMSGHLSIPRGVAGRLPVVICQHDSDGTPGMVTGLGQEKDTPYHEYGWHLAERGYVVSAQTEHAISQGFIQYSVHPLPAAEA